MNFAVIRIDFCNDVSSDFIENWKHACRLLCKPDCQSGLLVTDMHEVDLNWLFVILTHFLNAHFISVLLVFIGKSPQEVSEFFTNELNDFWLLNPSWKILLLLRVIIDISQILFLELIFTLHHLLPLAHFSHRDLRFAVFTIRHKGSWLSLLTSLHQSPLSINLTLSLSACLSIYNILLCVIDAFILIAVKFRSLFVITLKEKN